MIQNVTTRDLLPHDLAELRRSADRAHLDAPAGAVAQVTIPAEQLTSLLDAVELPCGRATSTHDRLRDRLSDLAGKIDSLRYDASSAYDDADRILDELV